MFHHNGQEFDDNFGAWSDQHLAFATFLSVVDRVKGIGEDIHANHSGTLDQGPMKINFNILEF